MKKRLITMFLLLILCLGIASGVFAAENEKTIQLIVWNDFCVIVRSPSQQLTTMIGQVPLGIILKDKKTRVTISNSYLVISIPEIKLKTMITTLKHKNIIFLE